MKNADGLRYKRTLFVGLGGAGARTLRILKKKILETNDGKVPKQIKFLLIDTNATELSNFRDFDNNEKICISVREPYQRYKHDQGSHTHEFIPDQNVHSLLALERGAGQIRSNGHFAVIENQYSNKLLRLFRERADELEDIDINGCKLEKDPKIEVKLVFSIAGGTGSGTFLPISILLRSAIKHCELTAYMYSATHYATKVENSAKNAVMQNAYAALCELDYMMHFGRNSHRHDNIKFNFGPDLMTQQIEQSNRPFDEVFYIDKHTALPDPDTVEFSYNELDRLQENTAEAMHISATNIISAHTGTVDNVRQKIQEGQFDVGDKYAWVSGMGIAELFFNTLDESNSKVVQACRNALNARTDQTSTLDPDVVDKIASRFIKDYKFEESLGPDDDDPVLTRFATIDDIGKKCREIVNAANADRATSDEFGVNLDNFISHNRSSESIILETTLLFDGYLDEMIKSLIDTDTFRANPVGGFNGNGPGMSFMMIKSVVEKIKEKLKQSFDKIKEEKTGPVGGHDFLWSKADENIRALLRKTIPVKTPRKWWQFGRRNRKNMTDIPNEQGVNNQIRCYQTDALTNMILSERDSKTLEVFEKCISIADAYISKIEGWQNCFMEAARYASTKECDDNKSIDTYKKENRVEVQMIKLKDGFRLCYSDIVKIHSDVKKGIITSQQGVYDAVSSLLVRVSGSLKDYLSAGLDEISSLTEDKHIKVDRTECQKNIDRLIDLSTPTMQVDKHGYGDRVKDDQFWYVMTSCPETTIADNSDEKSKIKSVGGLLKTLIEQNALDARVNLVHVEGWKNKAMIYRVDSAVPPYFVDGVCISTEGGYTLEGCYEELKNTRSSYTPFSHKTLQKKLENGICVLKPNDGMAESEAMEHWLNFNLLGRIHFESLKGTTGKYSVQSEKLGTTLTDDLVDTNSILILGETRQEAFETFSRYCKSIIEEQSYKDILTDGWTYIEQIDPLEYHSIDEFEKKFILTGMEYIDFICREYHLRFRGEDMTVEDLNSHLDKDDSEFSMLKKEMAAMNTRKRKYEVAKKEKELMEDVSDDYND